MPIDPSARISPFARVHPEAHIGPQTVISDFCIVEQDVSIGANCLLEPYVYIKRWTTLGASNEISAHTVLGTDPLDKGFTGERSYLILGNGNKVREHYTISRGTKPESVTTLGHNNFVMTSGHIAHNAVIGSNCVIASCALVAGYVEIEDQAFVSGGVGIHQFSKIGRLAMVGGSVRVNKDLPPFFLYGGLYATPKGLNMVGLRRAGFTKEQIASIKQAYRILYLSNLKLEAAVQKMEADIGGLEISQLVNFIRRSKRGICRPETAVLRNSLPLPPIQT